MRVQIRLTIHLELDARVIAAIPAVLTAIAQLFR